MLIDFDNEKWKTFKNFKDYQISNCGRIRRHIKSRPYSSTWPGKLLKPYIIKNSIRYNLHNKMRTRNITLNVVYSEYWPNQKLPNLLQLYNIIVKQNKIENDLFRPIKNASNHERNTLDRYVHAGNMRLCAKCKKPSGANYWCNKCRSNRCDNKNDSLQWYPEETYNLHL